MYLWLMKELSRTSGWYIGIHTGKRKYYYLVGSKTGEKYRPWVGVATLILMTVLMYVTFISFIGIAAFPAEYGIRYWPVSVVMFILMFSSGKAIVFLHSLFKERADIFDEDYEPSEEELRNWDKCVH